MSLQLDANDMHRIQRAIDFGMEHILRKDSNWKTIDVATAFYEELKEMRNLRDRIRCFTESLDADFGNYKVNLTLEAYEPGKGLDVQELPSDTNRG